MLSFRQRVVRSAWRVTPQRALSSVIGWWAEREVYPAAGRTRHLRAFAEKHGINIEEAEKPLEEYSGLQEFFTRRLRPGLRPLAVAPDAVLAPADGKIVESGLVSLASDVHAKDATFSLVDLLADRRLARRLDGGAYQITYLSPRDYHRVHAPLAGEVRSWCFIPGTLFPVNTRSASREPNLFSRNERLVTVMQTTAGLAIVVMVAAVGVGHITTAYDPGIATHGAGFAGKAVRRQDLAQPIALERGDELGTFNLGSTTIVIFEPGRVMLDPVNPGQAVMMGSALGRVLGREAASA